MRIVKNFCNWLLCDHITDLEIRIELYKDKLREVITENQELRASKKEWVDKCLKLKTKNKIQNEKCIERRCQWRNQ